MLVLIFVDVLIQPLHAAGDVRRFIGSVVEDRVGSGDPQRANQNQRDRETARVAIGKTLDPI
jgi:hypothetical protein